MLQLTAEVRTQVDTIKRLRNSAGQVEAIGITAADLQTVRNLLAHWAKVYLALEPYFDAQQCDDLRQQAAVLHRRLGESRDKFAAEFNQHTALVRIQKTARDLEERTQQYWREYAVAKLQAPRDRARFAQLLPHMSAAMPAIAAALADANRLAASLPAQPADVQLFHTTLLKLDSLLANLAGMNAQQTAFLTRLGSGAATLADISPALLQWCQDEGLAPLLKLSL